MLENVLLSTFLNEFSIKSNAMASHLQHKLSCILFLMFNRRSWAIFKTKYLIFNRIYSCVSFKLYIIYRVGIKYRPKLIFLKRKWWYLWNSAGKSNDAQCIWCNFFVVNVLSVIPYPQLFYLNGALDIFLQIMVDLYYPNSSIPGSISVSVTTGKIHIDWTNNVIYFKLMTKRKSSNLNKSIQMFQLLSVYQTVWKPINKFLSYRFQDFCNSYSTTILCLNPGKEVV